MMRQSSSRNQRTTKGFKIKNILQVCLLIAVCVWLLYQVKHSHDKKMALEERNSKISNNLEESRPEAIKFGRKDLPESVADTAIEKEIVTHNEEESEEAEEVETKQDNIEETEGRGAGDDDIDENDQERADEEAEQGGDFGGEEEKEVQLDELGILDNEARDEADANTQEAQEARDEADVNTQEAREEHYKGDDASSAVVRDTQAIESETGKLSTGNNNMVDEKIQNTEKIDQEIDEKTNNPENSSNANESGVVGGEGEIQSNNNPSMNETVVVETEPDVGSISNSSAVGSSHWSEHMQQETNSTPESIPNDQIETHENSTVIDAEANSSALENATVSMDAVTGQNTSAEMGHSTSENVVLEQTDQFNPTVGVEKSEERSNTSLSSNGDGAAAQGESTNSSTKVVTVAEEEKEARRDLSILPDAQRETKNIENIAAE